MNDGDAVYRGNSCNISITYAAGIYYAIVGITGSGGNEPLYGMFAKASHAGDLTITGATLLSKIQYESNPFYLISFELQSQGTVKFTFAKGTASSKSFRQRAFVINLK